MRFSCVKIRSLQEIKLNYRRKEQKNNDGDDDGDGDDNECDEDDDKGNDDADSDGDSMMTFFDDTVTKAMQKGG